MKIHLLIETAGAEDGYDEDEIPDFEQHKYDIGELLRSGYYDIVSIREAPMVRCGNDLEGQ